MNTPLLFRFFAASCISNPQRTRRLRGVVLLGLLGLSLSTVRAIEIADNFTYAGTNSWAASHALATDYANYPVFEAVGVLNMVTAADEFTGSATLLNSEWVLTAAHNWKTNTIQSLQFIHQGVSYEAEMSSLVQHPLWLNPPFPLISQDADVSQGWDIALFKLSTPITNSITFPELYTKSDEFGKVGITLGGGRIGTGSDPWEPQTNSPLIVYAAANIIDRITTQSYSGYGGGLLFTDFDSHDDLSQNTLGIDYATNSSAWTWNASAEVVTSLETAGSIVGTNSSSDQYTDPFNNILEGGTAPGDSGGPTFIFDESDGTWKLAGVTSWGVNPWDVLTNETTGFRGLYGDMNAFTRVSQNADWIYSIVPEPSTTALLAMCGSATILFFFLRRRKAGSVNKS